MFDVGRSAFLLPHGRVAESGLRHSTRNRAWGNPPWVRIPPLPPISVGNAQRSTPKLKNGVPLSVECSALNGSSLFRRNPKPAASSLQSSECRLLEEIRVASRLFNGTLLTPLSLLYEYALSLLFCMDHDRRLLVDDCPGAKSAEHDASIAFSDHE